MPPTPPSLGPPLLHSLSHLSTLLYTLREIAWNHKNDLAERSIKTLRIDEIAQRAVNAVNVEREIFTKLSTIRTYLATAFSDQLSPAQQFSSSSILIQLWTLIDEIFRSIASGLVFSLSFSSYYDNQSNLFAAIGPIETNHTIDGGDDDYNESSSSHHQATLEDVHQLDQALETINDAILKEACALVITLSELDMVSIFLQSSSSSLSPSSSSSIAMISIAQKSCLDSLLVLVKTGEQNVSVDVLGAVGRLREGFARLEGGGGMSSLFSTSGGNSAVIAPPRGGVTSHGGSGGGAGLFFNISSSHSNNAANNSHSEINNAAALVKANKISSGGFVSVRRRPSSMALPPDSPVASRTNGIASLMLTMSPLQGAVAPGRLRAVDGGGSSRGGNNTKVQPIARRGSKMASSSSSSSGITSQTATDSSFTAAASELSVMKQRRQLPSPLPPPLQPSPQRSTHSGSTTPTSSFQIDKHLAFLDNSDEEGDAPSDSRGGGGGGVNINGRVEGELTVNLMTNQSPLTPKSPPSSALAVELSHDKKNPPLAPSSPSSPLSAFSNRKTGNAAAAAAVHDDGKGGREEEEEEEGSLQKGTSAFSLPTPSLSSSVSKSPRTMRELDRARALLASRLSLSQEAVEGVMIAHSAGLVVWSDTLMHVLLSTEDAESVHGVPLSPTPSSIPTSQHQHHLKHRGGGEVIATRAPQTLVSQPPTSSTTAAVTTTLMTTRLWQKVAPNNEFKTASELMRMARTSSASAAPREGGGIVGGVLMSPVRAGSVGGGGGVEQESPYRTYNRRR